MSSVLSQLYGFDLHWILPVVLAAFVLSFIWLFFRPGWTLGRELKQSIARVKSLAAKGTVTDLDALAQAFSNSQDLRHCWSEFRETLHGQKQADAMGMMKVTQWRATAMAGTFFTDASLVDTRLKTEFFKHLPGILTGIGIIGTFSGLILGLSGFQVTDDASTARSSLEVLLKSVGSAFLISAIAIFLAMLITFVEKVIVSRRYADVERLCSTIDSLFESGAGEEYLSRLVAASETSATQAAHIKDALVNDLKTILSELTDRQVAALTASNAQTALSVSTAVTEALHEPLKGISEAVRTVSSQQGDAVNKLLTDVLASFAARMEGMFGGQLGGINELLGRTADTMQEAAKRFESLAGHIEQAGSGATDRMAQRVDALVSSMTERQAAADLQMKQLLEQIRSVAEQTQSDSTDKLNATAQRFEALAGQMAQAGNHATEQMAGRIESLMATISDRQASSDEHLKALMADAQAVAKQGQAEVGQNMTRTMSEIGAATAELLQRLQDQAAESSTDAAVKSKEFARQAEEAVNASRDQIAQLVSSVDAAAQTMKAAVADVRKGVDDNVARLGGASAELSSAATTLTGGLHQMAQAAGSVDAGIASLQTTAKLLEASAADTKAATSDYHEVRTALGLMVTDLRGIVEAASREAGMTAQVAGTLESAANKLVAAQHEAENYLQGVNLALAEAHKSFAEHVGKTLQVGNAGFHRELAQAVDILRSAIQELGDTLDLLPQGNRRIKA